MTFVDVPHIGDSPVVGLIGHFIRTFEKAIDESTLRDAVSLGAIGNAIHFEQSASPPYVHSATGHAPWTIYVGVAYLEGLWAYSYGLLVRHEHQMRLAAQEWKTQLSGSEEFMPQTLGAAEHLLEWSYSLPKAYIPWPHSLPSPRHQGSPQESMVAGKTGTIFRSAIAWLLHHELAHARYGHRVRGIPAPEMLEQEKDADIVAYSRFFDNGSTEHDRRLIGWSILVPHLYALATTPSPAALFAHKHLHVHHRLAHALAHLHYRDPHNQDYFSSLCADVVRLFYIKHGIDPRLLSGPKFARVDHVFQHLIDGLDQLDPSALDP